MNVLHVKTYGLGHAAGPRDTPDPPDEPDPVSSNAARDPAATCAGGQNDGTHTKLHQIIASTLAVLKPFKTIKNEPPDHYL